MQRQHLLIETLVRQQRTRTVPHYLFRKPQGPPSAQNKQLDRFLHSVAQDFDFGPLFTGDQQQARQIAMDFIEHVKKNAKRAKLDPSEVIARLKRISPHVRKGLLTFHSYFDAKVKVGQ